MTFRDATTVCSELGLLVAIIVAIIAFHKIIDSNQANRIKINTVPT